MNKYIAKKRIEEEITNIYIFDTHNRPLTNI